MMEEERQEGVLAVCRLLFAAAVCLAVLLTGTGSGRLSVSAASRISMDITYATYQREDGTLQIVDSNGAFVYDMIVVLVGGQLCYADKHGIVAQDQMFDFGGSKYFAETETGIILNLIIPLRQTVFIKRQKGARCTQGQTGR